MKNKYIYFKPEFPQDIVWSDHRYDPKNKTLEFLCLKRWKAVDPTFTFSSGITFDILGCVEFKSALREYKIKHYKEK